MYSILGGLKAAGLGTLPTALVKGLTVKTIPAILYGCEIWAATWFAKAVKGSCSPFVHERLNIVVRFLK
jgi:hypothetical protein